MKVSFKDLFFLFIVVFLFLFLEKKRKVEIQNIKKRLEEVCFRYNDSCTEKGNCTCIAKADFYDVEYIIGNY